MRVSRLAALLFPAIFTRFSRHITISLFWRERDDLDNYLHVAVLMFDGCLRRNLSRDHLNPKEVVLQLSAEDTSIKYILRYVFVNATSVNERSRW